MAGTAHIGVDTGGTFTDLVMWDGHQLHCHKVPSTPPHFADGVLDGVAHFQPRVRRYRLTHSATVATNALLERKGARTALITTAGFADVLEIARQDRPQLYDLAAQRAVPLVPRRLRLGIAERLAADGQVITALRDADVQRCLEHLEDQGIESLAISLLFSFVDPRHEQHIARLARACGWHVSASSDIVAEFREFERTSTTVINAFVAPVMQRYLGHLDRALVGRGCTSWRVMQSNGGSLSSREAGQTAVHTLLSGPAAGVVGALTVARQALQGRAASRIVTFDMGGTSTDVALLDAGRPVVTTESEVCGYPVQVPMMDIHTVGAGGGSIAALDPAGALQVGPTSAGADPGPACYGRGDRATVTDANVILGRIDPSRFLGGRLPLDTSRARQAVADLAERQGVTTRRMALAIVRLANAHMERALRVISTQRGHDPRVFTLVSFGGAGGLHACDLAAALGMPRVLVPRNPGVLSALGALCSDVERHGGRTVMWPGEPGVVPRLRREYARLSKRLQEQIRRDVPRGRIQTIPSIDLRYCGQSFEINVPWNGIWMKAVQDFHASHERQYGHADRGAEIEIVTIRMLARVATPAPRFPRVPRSARVSAAARLASRGKVSVYDRENLRAGNRLRGPSLIVEPFSSVWVPPRWSGRVDDWGHVVLEQH